MLLLRCLEGEQERSAGAQLEAEALVLEDKAARLEEQNRPVAAQAKLQQAKSKRDHAGLLLDNKKVSGTFARALLLSSVGFDAMGSLQLLVRFCCVFAAIMQVIRVCLVVY